MSMSHLPDPSVREWSVLTAPEIETIASRDVVAILPIGAIEQHGPHLPVDTDIHGAWEIAKRVAARVADTIVLPPVWWGYSATHAGFPGTLSLRPTTMWALLEDLCTSLVDQGMTKIVLLVAHASNRSVVNTFVTEFYRKYRVSLVQVNWIQFGMAAFQRHRRSGVGGSGHAGEFETSVELYLRPERVRQDRAVARYVRPEDDFGLPDTFADMTQPGRVFTGYVLRDRFCEGVMGDGTLARADLGKAIVHEAVEGIAGIVEALLRRKDEGSEGVG